jgi:hypothetical protein
VIVQQKTLPWIPGQQSPAPRNYKPRRKRGMGDFSFSFPYMAPAPGSDGSGLPCLPSGTTGPLAMGQNYCPGAATSTSDNWDSKTSPSVAAVCFQPLFPWVGMQNADGGCTPVVDVKSPWPLLITAGLGAFLGFRLLGGGR